MKVRNLYNEDGGYVKIRRNKPRDCFESDFMEIEELVEDFKQQKKEEMRKHHRQHKDKYFHDDWE